MKPGRAGVPPAFRAAARKRPAGSLREHRAAASESMREYMGQETMESPQRARRWLAEFLTRWPFTEGARQLFATVHFEIADLSQEHGGGYWYPETRTVQVRGTQAEALIHELAHAYWETARAKGTTARRFVAAVRRLAKERDSRYQVAATLAGHYVDGIPTQPDPDSPTGYWQGMRQPDGSWMDWEMFAGLASGTLGDLLLLPPYVRTFYGGLFEVESQLSIESAAAGT